MKAIAQINTYPFNLVNGFERVKAIPVILEGRKFFAVMYHYHWYIIEATTGWRMHEKGTLLLHYAVQEAQENIQRLKGDIGGFINYVKGKYGLPREGQI